MEYSLYRSRKYTHLDVEYGDRSKANILIENRAAARKIINLLQDWIDEPEYPVTVDIILHKNHIPALGRCVQMLTVGEINGMKILDKDHEKQVKKLLSELGLIANFHNRGLNELS